MSSSAVKKMKGAGGRPTAVPAHVLSAARRKGPLFEASLRALAVLREAVLSGKKAADGVDVLLAWALGHGVASLVELGLFDGPSLGAPRNVDALVMQRLVHLLSGPPTARQRVRRGRRRG